MDTQWRAAVACGALRPADVHLARRLAALAGEREPLVLLAAALASSRAGEGDVCLELAAAGDLPVFRHPALKGRFALPAPAVWSRALRASPLVAPPGAHAPLILDEADRLYLARFWQYEHDLAAGLRTRLGCWVPQVDRARLRAGLARLFPAPAAGASATDWQRVAAAVAVLRPLCVISGGPGTGKTHTVVAVLALLHDQADGRPLRVALAAPTGKAAARLTEVIRAARHDPRLPPAAAALFPEGAVTIHRLLGVRAGRASPRHGPQDPLPVDALVIDEVSMVDLPLMARVVAALPAHARLILLGDRDQLASVEPGRVLGDIAGTGTGAAPAYSAALGAALAEVGAAVLPPDRPGAGARVGAGDGDHVVVLRRSWRFGPDSGIGALAAAVNAGDATACQAVLADPARADVRWLPPDAEVLEQEVVSRFVAQFRQVLAAPGPAAALRELERVRVLVARRDGPWGVAAVNARLEQALERAGLIHRAAGELYAGRPVMVTKNDHQLRLYNGDVGLLLPDPDSGALRAWFAGAGAAEAQVRRVLPARLPPHETAYALTVHKSQGSEFDTVILLLPPAPGRGVTRELVYTGVTRARRQVLLLSTPAALAAALARTLVRTTGLRAALWGDGRGATG